MKNKGVYKIVNNINGKIYIGSTGSKGGFKKRWSYHLDGLRHNKHHSIHLQRAWNKYGVQSFTFEIIEVIENINILLEREQFYLDFYQSYDIKIGYNICKIAGSSLGIKKTPEQCLKMSEFRKGKPIPWLNTGKSRTKEHADNLSKSLKGRQSEKNGKTYEEFYGVDEAIILKNKLSEAHKGQFSGDKHPQAKDVVQLDLDGNIIREFGSAISASKELNMSSAMVRLYCQDKIKKPNVNLKYKY